MKRKYNPNPLRQMLRTALLLYAGYCFFPMRLAAQSNASSGLQLCVDTISIEGNRKTRASIILRELDFRRNDSLPAERLEQILERNRLRLINTRLFIRAQIRVEPQDNPHRVRLHIVVKEAWYTYPIPVFELADRNFNVWWNEFDHSLKRVNYGINWTQYNLTGRADVMSVNTIFGYTNKYELKYASNAINPKQTLGVDAGIGYIRVHETAVRTQGNKLTFRTDPDEWQLRRFQAKTALAWRPKLLSVHRFGLEYYDHQVADSIATVLNPDYFLQSRRRQQYVALYYSFQFDNRDNRQYPVKGWYAYAEMKRYGLFPANDVHMFRLRLEASKFTPLAPWLALETAGRVRVSLPRRQAPYYNNSALGYGDDLVRGYDYYVIDGLDFAVIKSAWRFKVFDRFINPLHIVFKKAKPFHVKAAITLNADAGIANDPYVKPENPLANELLSSCGIGADVLAFDQYLLRIEYTRNGLAEWGLFIRTRL